MIYLTHVARRRGKVWAESVHGDLLQWERTIPPEWPRPIGEAIQIACTISRHPPEISKLANVVQGEAIVAWTELLRGTL
jgi:hypothetical protein